MTMRDIIADVAKRRKIRPAELLSRRQNRYLVHARQEIAWRLMSVERDGQRRYSVTRIGQAMNRHYSTVVTSAQAYCRRTGAPYPKLKGAPR